MKRLSYALLALVLLLVGCSTAPNTPLYQRSAQSYHYTQPSFEDYQRESLLWLQNNRVFLTADKNTELSANAPFELRPEQPTDKGILLVHGLSGSPFFFRDIAEQLRARGFLVRVMLLPGHGSRPADLLDTELADWERSVEHQIALLKREVDTLWLAGFSTGANLVTSAAIADPSISGLLLFSPGFAPKVRGLALTPWISKVADWADIDAPSENYISYDSLPFQVAASYYHSTRKALKTLAQSGYKKPVLMAVSQDDVVIDAQRVYRLFERHFTHPQSRLLWYGARQFDDRRVISLPTSLAELQIRNFSHLSLLFKTDNPYFGRFGSTRLCEEELSAEQLRECRQGTAVWFAEYGHTEPGKTFARLTWNPHFERQARAIDEITAH
ncbi:MAG: alpha/beta hydrolase [Pseudomonadales bacterium]